MYSKKKQHCSSLNVDSEVHLKTVNCSESSFSNYILTEKNGNQLKQKPQSISCLQKNQPSSNQMDKQQQNRLKTQPSSSLHSSKNINLANSYSVMNKIIKQGKARNIQNSSQNASKLSLRGKDFKPKLNERFQTQAHATNISDDFEEGQNDSFFCREDDDLQMFPGQNGVNMIPVSPKKKHKVNNELEFFPSKKKIIHNSLPHQKMSIDGFQNATTEQQIQVIGNIQSNVLSETFETMNTCRGEDSQLFDIKCETVANCEENQQINNQQISRKIINKSLSSVNNQKGIQQQQQQQQQQIQQSEHLQNLSQKKLNGDEQKLNAQSIAQNEQQINSILKDTKNECFQNQFEKERFKIQLKQQNNNQFSHQQMNNLNQQQIQSEQLQSILEQQQKYLNQQKIEQKNIEENQTQVKQQTNSNQVVSPRNKYDQTRYFNQQYGNPQLQERLYTTNNFSDKYKEDYSSIQQWGYQSKKVYGIHNTCMTSYSPLKTEAAAHIITEVSQDNRRESSLFRLRYNCNSGLSQNNKELLNYYDQVLGPQMLNSNIRRISTNFDEQQQNKISDVQSNNSNYVYNQNYSEHSTVLVQNNSKINCNNFNLSNDINKNNTINKSNPKDKLSSQGLTSQKQTNQILSHTNSLNSTKSQINITNKNISMHSSRNSTYKYSSSSQQENLVQNKKHQSLSQVSNLNNQNSKYSSNNYQPVKNNIQKGQNIQNLEGKINVKKCIAEGLNNTNKQNINYDSQNNYQVKTQTIQQSFQPEQNSLNNLSNQFKYDIDTVLHYHYPHNKTNNTTNKSNLYQTNQTDVNIKKNYNYFVSNQPTKKEDIIATNLPKYDLKKYDKENKQTEISSYQYNTSKQETKQSNGNSKEPQQTNMVKEFQTNKVKFQANKIEEPQINVKEAQKIIEQQINSTVSVDTRSNKEQKNQDGVLEDINQSSKVKENVNYLNTAQSGSGQKSLMANIINLVVKTFRGGDKRDQCNCDEGLEDQQTCSRAQKWLSWNYPENLDSLKTLYNQIKETRSSVVDQSVLQQIKRDVTRTYPHMKFFQPVDPQSQNVSMRVENNQNKTVSGLEQLESILYSFAAYDPQIGYVQGINFIAAHFLYHSEEYIAFWLLVNTFERFELRDIYLPNLPGLKKHSFILEKILEKIDFELYNHLNENGIKPDMYITPWLFSQFGMMIPLKYLDIFYENMIEEGWSFFYKFVISYMIEQKQLIMEQDSMGTIEILTQKNNQIANEQYSEDKEWSDIIQDAKQIQINSKDIESMLNNINFQD